MTNDPKREFAKRILESIAADALLRYGNAGEAADLVKRATLKRLEKKRKKLSRETIAEMLGVSVRTVDLWIKKNREEQKAANEDGESIQIATVDIRLAGELFFLLMERPEAYRSLGQIVDGLKKRLRTPLTTSAVHRKLKALRDIGTLESPSDDAEMFRLAVRGPSLKVGKIRKAAAKSLDYSLRVVYDLAYGFFVGAPEAGLRMDFFEIPESQVNELANYARDEFRAFSDRLEKRAEELEKERPDESRVRWATAFFMGKDVGPQPTDDSAPGEEGGQ